MTAAPSQSITYGLSACRNGKALELTSGRIQHLFQVDCSVKTWKYSWQGCNKRDGFRLELLQVPEDYEFHSFFLRILERASAQTLFFLSFFFSAAFDSYSFRSGCLWHCITRDGNSMGLGKKEFYMEFLDTPMKWIVEQQLQWLLISQFIYFY